MTNPNLQAIQNAYQAMGRGDASVLLSTLAEDIEWKATGPGPVAGIYRGRDEVLSFFGKMGQVYGQSFRLDVVDMLASDEHVVVLTKEGGQHQGRDVEFRAAHVYTFSDGKCRRFLSFQDDAYIKFWLAAS